MRRAHHGVEVTGHLLYAVNTDGEVALLDSQTGGLARLENQGIRKLTLARFPRRFTDPHAALPPWQVPAPDWVSAVSKAEAWLGEVYSGEVVLVAPSAADETPRGWLFSCNTRRFQASGDWREAMVDAALVVPKDSAQPFGLPNTEPWKWLERWDGGAEPGDPGLALLPSPGPGAWLSPTLAELGSDPAAVATGEYSDWPTALAAVAALPAGARALVWMRRRDRAGRESVGRLLNAACTESGLVLIDPTREGPVELDFTEQVLRLHVIRYR